MKTTFWGVRGSVPAPITGVQLEQKMRTALGKFMRNPPKIGISQRLDEMAYDALVHDWMRKELSFDERSTFGGNTTCVEVRCADHPVILDMGTGLRELGRALMPQVVANKGVEGTILQSHLHWDHIQGFPFWDQLYMPRASFKNRFTFCGGKSWDAQLEVVLAGQMNAPVFPVNFHELRHTAMQMDFRSVHDGWNETFEVGGGTLRVKARKLNHPQETFGYRLEFGGKTLVFTTDHEPYAAGIPNQLLDLVRGADVWITDCQYTHGMYTGEADRVQKLGWGHSFPEYIASVAKSAKPGRVVTTHHDPSADDAQVIAIATQVAELSGIPTVPAYEGLTFDA